MKILYRIILSVSLLSTALSFAAAEDETEEQKQTQTLSRKIRNKELKGSDDFNVSIISQIREFITPESIAIASISAILIYLWARKDTSPDGAGREGFAEARMERVEVQPERRAVYGELDAPSLYLSDDI
jgi:hypothetical protein